MVSDVPPSVKFVSSQPDILIQASKLYVLGESIGDKETHDWHHTDNVLNGWVEESVDQDNCSQVRSSDLKKKEHVLLYRFT